MSLLTPDEIRARLNARYLEGPRFSLTDLADTALALYERNEVLEAVVKALAESYPRYPRVDSESLCRWCSWRAEHGHAPSCPWRMARELVEQP